MKAVILAAGVGRRLRPYTKNTPKCLLEVAGKEILAHQIDIFAEVGVKELVIVIGYKRNRIKKFLASYKPAKYLKITFIENKEYKSTGSSYSLWLARNHIKDEFICINADLLFHHNFLKELLNTKHPNAMIIEKKVELNGDMVKVIIRNNQIIEMTRKRDFHNYCGEAVGPVKFSKGGAKVIIKMIGKLIKKGEKQKALYFLMHDFAKKYPLFAIDSFNLPWFEIDTKEDLQKVEKEIKKSIIFDFDGVIINSEPLRYETYKKLFMNEFSVRLPEKMNHSLFGKIQKTTITYFLKKNKLKGDVDELIRKRKDLLKKTFSKKENIKLIPGIFQLLKFLKKNNFRMAVASSSNKDYIENILKILDIHDYFNVIISGDMIKKSKPDPEIFIAAANKLNAKKENCLVIEDSINGILAAKKGGMSVIAITSSFSKEELSLADKVICNLNEIKISDLVVI